MKFHLWLLFHFFTYKVIIQCCMGTIDINFSILYKHSLPWQSNDPFDIHFVRLIRGIKHDDIVPFRIVSKLICNTVPNQSVTCHQSVFHGIWWDISIYQDFRIQENHCSNCYNNDCQISQAYMTQWLICIFFFHIISSFLYLNLAIAAPQDIETAAPVW